MFFFLGFYGFLWFFYVSMVFLWLFLWFSDVFYNLSFYFSRASKKTEKHRKTMRGGLFGDGFSGQTSSLVGWLVGGL